MGSGNGVGQRGTQLPAQSWGMGRWPRYHGEYLLLLSDDKTSTGLIVFNCRTDEARHNTLIKAGVVSRTS
eukprot:1161754-Pelagomonas_calceolata.AAC.5